MKNKIANIVVNLRNMTIIVHRNQTDGRIHNRQYKLTQARFHKLMYLTGFYSNHVGANSRRPDVDFVTVYNRQKTFE